MLQKTVTAFELCKLLTNFPNFPSIIWIILGVDFLRNITAAGIYLALFTKMEVLRFTIPNMIMVVHYAMFIRGLSYLIGAWLADSYFGKYKIYVANITFNCFILHPLLCVATFYKTLTLEQKKLIFRALIYVYSLFSFGIGCAIPLYSEQFFLPEEEKELRSFYIIYFWLNHCSVLIGTLLFQLLINCISCFNDKCIAIPILAYVVSDFIYLIVLIICRKKFLFRNIKYKVIEENICLVLEAIFRTLKTDRMPGETRRSALDLVRNSSNRAIVKCAQRLCNLMPIFLSFLGFWTTKAQLRISWFIQALFLRNHYYFDYSNSKTIFLINTFFIVIFTPILYIFITPLLRRWRRYLKWTGFGIFFMSLSLWISTLLQNAVELGTGSDVEDTAYVRIYNALSVPVFLESNWTGRKTLASNEMLTIKHFHLKTVKRTPVSLKTTEFANRTRSVLEAINRASISYIVKNNSLIRIEGVDPLKHSIFGPIVYFLCGDKFCKDDGSLKLTTRYSWEKIKKSPLERKRTVFTLDFPGFYDIYFNNRKKLTHVFYAGGIYCILMNHTSIEQPLNVYEVISPHMINIYGMVSQFVFSALADTFAWIPMQMFVYVQSPTSMRATTAALYLLIQLFGYGILGTSAIFENYYFYIMIICTVSSFILLIAYIVLAIRYKSKLPKDQ